MGTDLDTTLFDTEVAKRLTAKVRPLGSYIKGHYTDDVDNPQDYPLCGMGAANVGPEFTIGEYRALCELEELEKKHLAEGRVAVPSNMKAILLEEVHESHRWEKWLHADEQGLDLRELTPSVRTGLWPPAAATFGSSPSPLRPAASSMTTLAALALTLKASSLAASSATWTSTSTPST